MIPKAIEKSVLALATLNFNEMIRRTVKRNIDQGKKYRGITWTNASKGTHKKFMRQAHMQYVGMPADMQALVNDGTFNVEMYNRAREILVKINNELLPPNAPMTWEALTPETRNGYMLTAQEQLLKEIEDERAAYEAQKAAAQAEVLQAVQTETPTETPAAPVNLAADIPEVAVIENFTHNHPNPAWGAASGALLAGTPTAG